MYKRFFIILWLSLPSVLWADVCITKVWTTDIVPVSFYVGGIKLKNWIGTYTPTRNFERTFDSRQLCLENGYIYAVTVQNNYRSKQRFTNINDVALASFPEDFITVPRFSTGTTPVPSPSNTGTTPAPKPSDTGDTPLP